MILQGNYNNEIIENILKDLQGNYNKITISY